MDYLKGLFPLSKALLKKNMAVLVGFTLVFILVGLGITLLPAALGFSDENITILILTIIASSFLALLYVRLLLSIIDNDDFENETSFGAITPTLSMVISLSVFQFMISLAYKYLESLSPVTIGPLGEIVTQNGDIWMFIVIALLLFYFYIRLFFVQFLIADENINFMNAVIISYKMTNGKFFLTLLCIIIMMLLVVLGLLFFGFGVFITYPLGMLFMALYYRKAFTDFQDLV